MQLLFYKHTQFYFNYQFSCSPTFTKCTAHFLNTLKTMQLHYQPPFIWQCWLCPFPKSSCVVWSAHFCYYDCIIEISKKIKINDQTNSIQHANTDVLKKNKKKNLLWPTYSLALVVQVFLSYFSLFKYQTQLYCFRKELHF